MGTGMFGLGCVRPACAVSMGGAVANLRRLIAKDAVSDRLPEHHIRGGGGRLRRDSAMACAGRTRHGRACFRIPPAEARGRRVLGRRNDDEAGLNSRSIFPPVRGRAHRVAAADAFESGRIRAGT